MYRCSCSTSRPHAAAAVHTTARGIGESVLAQRFTLELNSRRGRTNGYLADGLVAGDAAYASTRDVRIVLAHCEWPMGRFEGTNVLTTGWSVEAILDAGDVTIMRGRAESRRDALGAIVFDIRARIDALAGTRLQSPNS